MLPRQRESVPNRSRRRWQQNRCDVSKSCADSAWPSSGGLVAVADGSDETPVGGSSSDARQVDRRAAVVMTTATTTAACTRARAARALYTLQQGPRSTKRAPSTAIEFQRARLRVGKTAFTSTTMWRMFAARTGGPRALARSRRRARAAATSRVTGPVLAASSTSEMHCRSQWSRSGLSECNHVAVDGHHLMPV